MAGGVIPVTPLRKFYDWLRNFPSGTNISSDVVHQSMLTFFNQNPEKLSWLVKLSAKEFQEFNNANEPFHPKRGEKFSKSTSGGTVRFQQAARNGQFDCRIGQSSCIEYQYVDREVGTDRVTQGEGESTYADGREGKLSGRGGIDMLLRAKLPNDRVLPAVCELKIGDDSTPFLALIQALTYAVELATPSQYVRLKKHYPDFAELDGNPKVQVCLFSSATPKQQQQIQDDTNLLVEKLFDKKCSIAAFIPQVVVAKCTVNNGQFRLSDATMYGLA